MALNEFQRAIAALCAGDDLSEERSARVFQILMQGGATPPQMAALLVALKIKGETVEELSGALQAVRAKMQPFSAPDGVMDVCGTGGDGHGTLNISTATALVLAGCGVPVAKHGNRAVSSQSGSSDVLSALGVHVQAAPERMERALREANFCFLHAPLYHLFMRHVAPVRQELGLRTLFNLIGPLANPARPKRQLIGVYDRALLPLVAQTLQHDGATSALIVHGEDGMDELTPQGVTFFARVTPEGIKEGEMTPEEAGLPRHPPEAIKGGDAVYNARALSHLLNGKIFAYRDAVLYNAAAALMVAGLATDLKSGAALAASAIDTGRARQTLDRLIEVTNRE